MGVRRAFHSVALSTTVTAVVLGLAASAGAVSYPFADSFEFGLGAWQTNGYWGLTTQSAVSPSHSASDSPASFYSNSQDASLTLASALNLTAAVRPALSFQRRHILEPGWDVVRVEVSTNGGGTWSLLSGGTYTGTQMDWTRDQFDLDAYVGQSDLRIRFRLVTDASVTMDGFYLDDMAAAERPVAATLSAVTTTANTVSLRWTASTSPDFAAYRIYRAMTPGGDWHAAVKVAEIVPAGETNWTDIALAPKSTYYYRVMTVTTRGVHALGNELTVTTPAGMDYPFVDRGEAGGATWLADAPWALTMETAVSPTHAWSDSPGGDYGDGVNAALTLSAPLNLLGSSAPVVFFRQHAEFRSTDYGYVEASTNSGASWTVLYTTPSGTSVWLRTRLSLAAFTGSSQVLLRFRVSTDTTVTDDGWHLDDIAVCESPSVVAAPTVTDAQPHSLRVNWAVNADPAFAAYAVFRDTSPSPDMNGTLVATITNQATATFVDTGLALDTTYYYRVYAVNPHGAFSAASASAGTGRTTIHPLPFADGFEGTLEQWTVAGTWGFDTNAPAAGGRCASDSPAGNYTNGLTAANNGLRTAVNLTGTDVPVLRWRDRYMLAAGDYGFMEVSPDGGTWYRLYCAQGGQTNWSEREVCLVQWKGQPNLRIRFWMQTDGGGAAEGWSLDDVRIENRAATERAVPFTEDFEAGMSRWVESNLWTTVTNAPYNGARCMGDRLERFGFSEHRLTLDGKLNLASATSPTLVFWFRGLFEWYTWFGVEVSTDGGMGWTTVWAIDSNSGPSVPDWRRVQVSLTGYRSTDVRVRFRAHGGNTAMDLYVDKVTVEEAPAAVNMVSLTPHLKTMDVDWSASGLGGAFQRYEVYRSLDGTVDLADTRVGTFGNAATVSMTDSNLTIGTTYYYGVYVVDNRDAYTPSANVLFAATVPAPGIGFTDPMENLSLWDTTGAWGVETNRPYSGSGCISDSPGAEYGPSLHAANNGLRTAVNLTGTDVPVLRFRDRYMLAANDYGFLEVSPDGGTWYRLYGAQGGQTNWSEHEVCLVQWKGQPNLRIRFWLQTDGGGAAEGWSLDDVRIENRAATERAVPFTEDFEAGMSRWVESNLWTTVTNAPYNGERCMGDRLERFGFSEHRLTLDGKLNLASATSPTLVFWFRGLFEWYTWFGVEVSTDGGMGWTTVWAIDSNSGPSVPDWRRVQVSLTGYRSTDVRVRFRAHGGNTAMDLYVDKVTVEEAPAAVNMVSLTPHLKTMDVDWSASGLGGAFQRYEVYRSLDGTVDLADTRVGTFGNAATVSMTDSNLTIGTTYYYGVYVVDNRDAYTPSANVLFAATVPAPGIGFTDPMENLSLWDTTGAWGVETNRPYSGSGCISDSPGAEYGPSLHAANNGLRTAVNLTGTDVPVLRFRDRYMLAANDYGFLEVSPDGGTWYRLYGAQGGQTNWSEHEVCLVQWKGQPNLRIRFWLQTDGGGAAEGWSLDDVRIENRAAPEYAVPFTEDFEAGMSRWVESNQWTTVTNAPYDGARCAGDRLERFGFSEYRLTLDGKLNLASAANPTLVFWFRGLFEWYTWFGVDVSTDGGASWANLWAIDASSGPSVPDWRRVQVSLTGYRSTDVRVRFRAHGGNTAMDLYVDKVTIEEAPAAVNMVSLTPHLKTMDVSWGASGLGGAFQRYEVFRSPDGTVDMADTRVGTFTNAATVSMTDSNLTIGTTYFYGVYVVDNRDAYTPSANVLSAATVPAPGIGFTDPMDNLGLWDATGAWGVDTNSPHAGPACISDSPVGQYANGLTADNNGLRTAVSLAGADVPVLRWSDRFKLAANDYGFLEVSPDGGTWTRLYCAQGGQTNWSEHEVCLLQWKGRANLRIRFYLSTDGAGTDEGWSLDDVRIENRAAPEYAVPFLDGFEAGIGRWVESNDWGVATGAAYSGTNRLHSRATLFGYSTEHRLTLGGRINLAATTAPTLSFWYRSAFTWYTWFGVQVSADGGTGWTTLWALDSNSGPAVPDWTKISVSLASYRTPDVRVRFLGYSSGNPAMDVSIDAVGIGDGAPGAPTLHLPSIGGDVNVLRPMLRVVNAPDGENDALTYRFEVYRDVGLTNLVAQVPAVAEGAILTGWTLDLDLQDLTQYWWRCRASDASTTGPWSATGMFYVNLLNLPPTAPAVAAPLPGSIIETTTGVLSWRPSTDANAGDRVAGYHVQVDDSPAFDSPAIDDDTLAVSGTAPGTNWVVALPLQAMLGAGSLQAGTHYYWRVRGGDTRDAWSVWSSELAWFYFGIPAPNIQGARMAEGRLALDFERTSRAVYVEFSTNLLDDAWVPIAGPYIGTNATVEIPTNHPVGFFRLVTGESGQ